MIKIISAIVLIHFFIYVLWLILKEKINKENRAKLAKTLGMFSLLSIVSTLVLSSIVFLF